MTDHTPIPMPSGLLMLGSETLSDLEKVRIAMENRYRTLTRDVEDSDGEIRGFGLDETHPDVARAAGVLMLLRDVEDEQTKALQRLMKTHPLAEWVKNSKGVGEKQAARLIAATGDPYIAQRVLKTEDGKTLGVQTSPRALREFLAYCGLGIADDGQARKRKKGERANWNASAKMRVWLIANSIVKTNGPLRDVYDEARAKYDEATHTVDCVRCGPSGKPALAGSPLSKGHAHARALRAVSVAVLTGMYYAAKDWHESQAIAVQETEQAA